MKIVLKQVIIGLCATSASAQLFAQNPNAAPALTEEAALDADMKSLDPATRVKNMEDKLGKDFVDGAKNASDAGSALKNLSNLKSVWNSSPSFKEPSIDGIDVTDILRLEEIRESVGVYHYSAFGKPDPFVPPYDQFKRARVVSTEIPIVSPLQVPLSSLRISGMWQLDDGSRRALIMTPKNEGVIAEMGDPIGLSGKIIDIQDYGIMVRQYKLRADGSREFQDTTLAFGDSLSKDTSDSILLEPGKDPSTTKPATVSAAPVTSAGTQVAAPANVSLPNIGLPQNIPAELPKAANNLNAPDAPAAGVPPLEQAR